MVQSGYWFNILLVPPRNHYADWTAQQVLAKEWFLGCVKCALRPEEARTRESHNHYLSNPCTPTLPVCRRFIEGVREVDAGGVVIVVEVGAPPAGVGLTSVVVLGTPSGREYCTEK